ncbi:MAG: hypothetical protein UMU75_07520 [Halomonas sp.]|nr:hypothetical protein [Halomonas sp.]
MQFLNRLFSLLSAVLISALLPLSAGADATGNSQSPRYESSQSETKPRVDQRQEDAPSSNQ